MPDLPLRAVLDLFDFLTKTAKKLDQKEFNESAFFIIDFTRSLILENVRGAFKEEYYIHALSEMISCSFDFDHRKRKFKINSSNRTLVELNKFLSLGSKHKKENQMNSKLAKLLSDSLVRKITSQVK